MGNIPREARRDRPATDRRDAPHRCIDGYGEQAAAIGAFSGIKVPPTTIVARGADGDLRDLAGGAGGD
jgi:hypothetical protein